MGRQIVTESPFPHPTTDIKFASTTDARNQSPMQETGFRIKILEFHFLLEKGVGKFEKCRN